MKTNSKRSAGMKFFRETHGPLTDDLVLTPGRFGLGRIPLRLKPDQTTSMVCGYCSTGCGLTIHLREGSAVNLTPSTEYPVNLGMACPKGWEALTPLSSPDRATIPLFRNARREPQPVSWDLALDIFCNRLRSIQHQHGPHSVAWLGTGQLPTEELALLGALAKFGLGILHGDGNTRQCMATAATAYKQSFGFDAPPFTYADFEHSDVIVLIGSNLCIAHPILWQRILRNPNNPRILVIDPRRTETAQAATHHFAIRAKSDLTLLYGLANLLVQKNGIALDYIAARTTGFTEFQEFIREFTSEKTAAVTGLAPEEFHRLAETIQQGRRVSFWWTMGVNQSHEGTRVAQAIINLALMTGNMGRPGTGANSITGQCNAMGSRIFSNTTSLLGGRDFCNPAHRRRVAEILKIPPGLIPAESSLAYDQIIEAIDSGRVKALWVIGTNPSHSWIDQARLNRILPKLEFLVVQDMFHNSETAQLADLLLPAAGWGEKEGTFINSERRVGLIKKIAPAPGQALSDFHIFKLIAAFWGCAEMFRDWSSPEAVFHLLKDLSRGRPCDLSGIDDYAMLDASGGIQWPCPQAPPGGRPPSIRSERRLFEDGQFYHSDGKARFIFSPPRAMPEMPDPEFPFLLLTGRGTSAQWHTGTRTLKSAVLRHLYPPKVYFEINPWDAAQLDLGPSSLALIRSRRGSIEAHAFVTCSVQRGHIFIPMHYPETNRLTLASFDPHSRQPSYKACAISVEKVSNSRKRITPSRTGAEKPRGGNSFPL